MEEQLSIQKMPPATCPSPSHLEGHDLCLRYKLLVINGASQGYNLRCELSCTPIMSTFTLYPLMRHLRSLNLSPCLIYFLKILILNMCKILWADCGNSEKKIFMCITNGAIALSGQFLVLMICIARITIDVMSL